MIVDLHSHSTHSDGTWSVKQILIAAEKKGIEVLAITDHDNLNGTIEAFELKDRFYSGKLIGGIEISTHLDHHTIHLLAFFPNIPLDPDCRLVHNLEKIQNSRITRMKKMIVNANNLGFEVTFEDVLQEAGTGIYGGEEPTDILSRPHLARVLLTKGYVDDFDEAFDKYLGDGKPIHEYRFSLSLVEWIRQIREQNGLIVWAHPLHGHDEDLNSLKKIAFKLLDQGIDGVETIYDYDGKYNVSEEFNIQGTSFLENLVQEHELLITSGGDFHGNVGKIGELELSRENWVRFQEQLYH